MQDRTYSAYPVEARGEGSVSTRVRRPKVHIRLRPLCFPERGERRWATMGLLMAAVAAVCVGVWVAVPRLTGGWGASSVLPSATTEAASRETDPETAEEVGEVSEPVAEAPEEQPSASDTEEGREEPSEEAPPSDGEAEASTADGASADTAGQPDGDTSREDTASDGTASNGTVPDDTLPNDTALPPCADPNEPDATAENGGEETAEDPAETAEPEDDTPETARPDTPAAPEGWIPVLSRDVSEMSRGAGYVVGLTEHLPASLPTGRLWEGTPAVLLVNTHPYEGFSDGSSLYDPASGGLAVTETPYDPDGVVAFGSALTRALRGLGVTVIHLRVPTSAGESAGVIYDRTEAMIRYYCRLYPDIGLVLDLRRSAELTEGGEILRTAGCLGGEDCGQLRISVSGGKDQTALGWDLTAALALRRALWEIEPTVSRPVRVKSGQGLIPELTGVRVLTVEAGSAGNTYAEAARLVAPLADAVAAVLEGT